MAKDSSRKVSLTEVAEIAGVSISTVSKVANGGTDVSDSTRARVEAILREHGYSAHRRRRTGRQRLALLGRDMHSPYILDVLRGALAAAVRGNVDITVGHFPSHSHHLQWIDDLADSGHAGLIAVTSRLNAEELGRLARHGLPVVSIEPRHRASDGTYSIGCTNWAGGLEATEHLIGLGHRRITMLAGLADTIANQARVSGFLAAVSAAGIDQSHTPVLPGDFTYDSGLEVGLLALAEAERPTAIFAASDFQALGVLEAARRLSIRVPEELSVVGFDDLIVAQMSAPALTTIRQPITKMGAAAVETLLALLADTTARPSHTELATALQVRSSTTTPPA